MNGHMCMYGIFFFVFFLAVFLLQHSKCRIYLHNIYQTSYKWMIYMQIFCFHISKTILCQNYYLYICQKMKEKNIEKEDLDYSTHSSLSDLVDDIILFLFLMGKKNWLQSTWSMSRSLEIRKKIIRWLPSHFNSSFIYIVEHSLAVR